MAAHEIVDADRNPFLGKKVSSKQTKAERAGASKVGFAPADVPKLWEEAERYGDFELSYAIQLSAHMGWRLEEVCRLKIADVHRAGGLTYIAGGMKSEAGLRSIPVPSAILPLVRHLMKRTNTDGYLIRSTADNKWKLRGTGIGTRFSKMKRRMGYDRRRTYHSLKHTYTSLLAQARCPLGMVRDLAGHEGNGEAAVTLGYIDEHDLRARLIWLDKAIRFDSAEPALEDDED